MTVETPLIDIRPDHWEIVRGILKKHVSQHEVWAFGSRAIWKAKEFSDLDLAIITEHPLTLDISASLSDDFSNSDLPYKVDVVDWATTSESFRKIIERDKVVMQEENKCLVETSDWPTAKIGDVCLRVTKGTTPTTGGGAFADKGIAFIKVEAITDSGGFLPEKFAFIDAETDERLARSKLQDKDILFTIAGTIGRVAQVANDILPANTNQAVAIVRPNPDLIVPRYLYYVLRDSKRIQLAKSKVVQSVQANFSLGELSSIELPLPSQNEQRAIAHVLGTLDDKIELNRKQNETLEAMARALFKAWFVDFEPVRAKMEGRWQRGQSMPGLPAHLYDLFPDRLVDSEQREIPEGWETQPLGQLLNIIGGGTPKTSNLEYWGGDIPWFSVADTPQAGDVFVVETEKSITQIGLDTSSARLVPKGTTIISARGTVGNLAIAGRDMAFNQSCYGLRGVGGAGDCFVYLVAHQMVSQLKSMAHGSVFSTITRQTFDAIEQPLPPLAVLQEFEKSVAPLFEVILSNVEESRSLAEYRDDLLTKLISGELRVKDVN